ncbi:hypothetical protein N9345_05625 [Candidatus Thioglobus sp.]|nr:hypothetical protein [Candidatus Thioglobus sp.]MDB3893642.1 hypothetical protein [Candidatus Thioglobus sp.]MDC0888630.1 hypothetical protein [Candidatus Thioglobus sp.]MDC0904388.1 hypothetical protein [Candidatus Thioglobus sp.]MDC0919889.1 hypothetical protein [Candidatus Thioglobus sp.]
MENKSLFSAIVLAFALIAGYFFYSEKLETLEQETAEITKEYNQKLNALQPTKTDTDTSDNAVLESLNNQLIKAQSALKISQEKLSLVTSKTSVLGNEISQISDARIQVKTLKGSLKSVEKKLGISTEKLSFLQGVFETQNKTTVEKNIARIEELKETSSGIAITGLIVPVIGVATLVSYTTEEINNYCANIKNTIELENQVFGKIVSLDKGMQKSYHNQCEVSLKDKIKKGLKKLQAQ